MSLDGLVALMEAQLAVNPKPVIAEQDIARSTSTRPNGNALAYIYRTLGIMGQINAALVASAGPGSDLMRWKGFIAANGDFPAVGDAQTGWTYYVTVGGVTDPVTLQTFNAQDLIIWNGVNWSVVAGQTITNPVIFKGAITVNTDFPLLADVESGWLYRVLADVTDDAGPPRTNTGQSFKAGDEVVWNGVDWTNLGPASFAASAVTYDNAVSGLLATDVQAAIDELAGSAVAAFARVAYVADGAVAGGDGSLASPYENVADALTAIGQPTNAAEYQEDWLIDVLTPGTTFVGDLVVPHRAITIRGQGLTIQGNILREISDEKEYGVSSSVWRGTLTLMGQKADYRDTHQGNRQGIKVTGNYRCKVIAGETGATTHDTYLYDTRIDGTFTADDGVVNGGAPSVGTEVLYAYDSLFAERVEGRTLYCQRWKHTQVKAETCIIGTIIGMEDCVFAYGDEWSGYNPMTVTVSGFSSGAPNPDPNYNFIDCWFYDATFAVPLGPLTISLDAVSMKSWYAQVITDNPVTLTLADVARGVEYDNATSGLTAVNVQDAIDELATGSGGILSEVFADTNEPTGFVNTNQDTTAVLGAGPGAVSFTLTPTGPSFDYWIKGVKYTKTGPDVVTVGTGNIEGFYVIYYAGAVLTVAAPGGSPGFAALLKDYAYVGAVYWDATNDLPLYQADERHGLMPWETHYNIHFDRGTSYLSGLGMANFLPDQSGALITHAQFSIGAGNILDEDITNALLARIVGDSLPVFYKTGASGVWRTTVKANGVPTSPLGLGGSSRAQFNEFTGGVWTQTQVGNNNDFILAHILATNDPRTGQQFVAIQGQAEYQNLGQARAGAATEVNDLVLAGLTFAEFIFIGTIIFQTSAAYGNAEQVTVRSTDTGADYVDFRNKQIAATGGGTDHGSLGGLLDDDHPQYPLVSGRLAAQTAFVSPTAIVTSLPLALGQVMHLKVQASAIDAVAVGFSVEEIWTFLGQSDPLAPTLIGVKTTVHSQQTAAAYTLAISAVPAPAGNVDIFLSQGGSPHATNWRVNIESAIIAP